jgi:signal transduction histidine kinase
MNVSNQPWPYLATIVLVAWMGLYAWKQPNRPGTRYFRWMIGVWLVWALAAVFSTVLRSLPLRYALWVVQSTCALLTSPTAVLFSLGIPALIFVLMVALLPESALVSIKVRSGVAIFLPNDIVLWTTFTGNIAIWLINFIILTGCLLRVPAFRTPILWLLLGQIVPRVAYILLNRQQIPVSPVQAIMLVSNFTAIIYFAVLYHFQILQINPVARDTVMNHMPYGMIVVDEGNRLIDFNLAAQRLPGIPGNIEIRQPAAQVLGDWWERISTMIGPATLSQEIIHQDDGGHLHFNVQSVPLLQPSGWRIGQVFVIEDITQLRHAQQQQAQMQWAQASLQEREQLAHELHDGLSQGLAFLNLQAQAAQVQIQTGQSQAAQAGLRRLTEAAGQIQEETRELIGNLLSVSLPGGNFCMTVQQILAGFEQQTGLTTRLEMEEDSPEQDTTCFDSNRLPPQAAVQLIRITQEALANVRKHAKGASQVIVQMKARNEQLFMTIMDDGSGFNPAKQQNGRNHFGLQVMRQRAERIGGQITIDTAPGKGTRLEICAPLTNPETRSWE